MLASRVLGYKFPATADPIPQVFTGMFLRAGTPGPFKGKGVRVFLVQEIPFVP
jgi:hypothetical protein